MGNPKLYLSIYPKTDMNVIYQKIRRYYAKYPEERYKTIFKTVTFLLSATRTQVPRDPLLSKLSARHQEPWLKAFRRH